MLHSVILTLLFISLRVSISWGIYTWVAWLKAHCCHVQRKTLFEAYFLFKLTRHKSDVWNRPENLIFFPTNWQHLFLRRENLFLKIYLLQSLKPRKKQKQHSFTYNTCKRLEKPISISYSEPSLRLTTKLCLHNQGGRTVRLSQC